VREYVLWGNDTKDGDNPHELYRGLDLSYVEPYGTGYVWFAVQAIGNDGTAGPLSAWVTDVPVVTAPQNVTLTMLQDGYEASWDAVANATGYMIERSTDGQEYTEIVGPFSSRTVLLPFKESPSNGGLHTIRVAALSITGSQGEWSDYVSHTSLPPAPNLSVADISFTFDTHEEGWQATVGGVADAGWTDSDGSPELGCLYGGTMDNANDYCIWASPELDGIVIKASTQIKWRTRLEPGGAAYIGLSVDTSAGSGTVDEFTPSEGYEWEERVAEVGATFPEWVGETITGITVQIEASTGGEGNTQVTIDNILVVSNGSGGAGSHTYAPAGHQLRWTQDSPELVKAWNVYLDEDGVPGDETLFATVTEPFVEIPYTYSEEYFAVEAVQWNGRTSADKTMTGPWPAAQAVTIADDTITRTRSYHIVSAESGTADDLVTINGSSPGDLLVIQPASGHTITVKDGAGNIVTETGDDVVLAGSGAHLLLVCGDDGNWHAIGDNAAPVGAEYLGLAIDPRLLNMRRLVLQAPLVGTDGGAGEDYSVSVGLGGLDEESSPADADLLLLEKSGGGLKKVQIGNLPGATASGAWPLSDVLTVDSSGSGDHPSVAAALAAVSDSQTIQLNSETFSEANLGVSGSILIAGVGNRRSIIQSSGAASFFSILGIGGAVNGKVVQLKDLQLLHNNPLANELTAALLLGSTDSFSLYAEDCVFDATNSGGGLVTHAVRCYPTGGTKTLHFKNCRFVGNSTSGSRGLQVLSTGTISITLEECEILGDLELNNANATVELMGGKVTGSIIKTAGTLIQTDMSGYVQKTSANRPGVTRLYRRDSDSGYSVQTDFLGGYWRLYGYDASDNAHAGVDVAHATQATNANFADYATLAAALANGQTMELVATVSLGGNGVIDFNYIPQFYKHLIVIGRAQSTAVLTTEALGCEANGDTGANYAFVHMTGYGDGRVLSSMIDGINQFRTIPMAGASLWNAAYNFTGVYLCFPDYRSNVMKYCVPMGGFAYDTNNTLALAQMRGSIWKSGAAISRLTFTGLGARNLAAGTTLSLYGVRG
jgi:hypothetical protein